jgi:hypothetical protein
MTDSTTTTLLTREERLKALLLEHCWDCRYATADGTPWPEVEKAHKETHHDACHDDCCGGCEACYANWFVYNDLYEWEKAVND